MEWGDGRECWFSHLLCSVFYETLEATPTARMLSCKKELPDQSNTLSSPKNVPLRYGRWQALQDCGDGEPILEELEKWSLPLGAPLCPRDWRKSLKTYHHALVIYHQGIHHQDRMEADFGKERDTGSDSQVVKSWETRLPGDGGGGGQRDWPCTLTQYLMKRHRHEKGS